MARMHDYYKDTVAKQLMDRFGYKSVMEVPRITKITLNMGVGEAVGDKKVMDHAVGDMTPVDTILAQHGVIIVFNSGACMGRCLSERGFNPSSAKFSAFDGGIEADDTELICVRVARIARFCFRNYF